jgi:single-stranded DNA-specific DHH superfamily exonuclease
MRRYDVFNGDADGICALHQLRLAEPVHAELVTGTKRDIELLRRVDAQAGDEVTVLDISLERNREALLALLAKGVRVHWFDHHDPGEVPKHPGLTATIDTSGSVCTSILVDRHLGGRFRAWAVVAAFGDNLIEPARELATTLGLDEARARWLQELGTDLNYGAYGETEADVLLPAIVRYRIVSGLRDPFALRDEPVLEQLAEGRREDMRRALEVPALLSRPGADAYMLPDAPWSRRVIGTFANHLAAADPRRAHAVLTPNGKGGYLASVRSPEIAGMTAMAFCARFSTGGGRARAAGIDHLARERLDAFLEALGQAWGA